jgi:LPS sulfotransferase NodH
VWGGKLMWNQVPLLVARTRVASGSLRTAVAELLGADPVYIHVYREDVVPQAVSMWRAVQTRVWRDGSGTEFDAGRDERAVYDARGIAHLAGLLREQERQWRAWFDSEGIEPVDIGFQKLIADPTAVTAQVLERLGQDPALAPPPPLKPQSNGRSREWAERYRHDAAKNGYPQ